MLMRYLKLSICLSIASTKKIAASIGRNPTALADEGIANGRTALWFRNLATQKAEHRG